MMNKPLTVNFKFESISQSSNVIYFFINLITSYCKLLKLYLTFRRGLVMGVWNAHTSLGNIFGGFIGGAFVDYDWALTFIVPAAMIAFVGIIVFIFLFPCKNSS